MGREFNFLSVLVCNVITDGRIPANAMMRLMRFKFDVQLNGMSGPKLIRATFISYDICYT